LVDRIAIRELLTRPVPAVLVAPEHVQIVPSGSFLVVEDDLARVVDAPVVDHVDLRGGFPDVGGDPIEEPTDRAGAVVRRYVDRELPRPEEVCDDGIEVVGRAAARLGALHCHAVWYTGRAVKLQPSGQGVRMPQSWSISSFVHTRTTTSAQGS